MTGRRRFGAGLLAAALTWAVVLVGAAPAEAATPVKITQIYYNSPGTDNRSNTSLNAEYVVLKNTTTRAQTITGWTVRDVAGHAYKFPTTSIAAGKTIVLRTGKGTNNSTTRYWQQSNYIWNNDKDTAYLRTAAGTQVQTCSYNSTAQSSKTC
jgi:Lamin Tail Domain